MRPNAHHPAGRIADRIGPLSAAASLLAFALATAGPPAPAAGQYAPSPGPAAAPATTAPAAAANGEAAARQINLMGWQYVPWFSDDQDANAWVQRAVGEADPAATRPAATRPAPPGTGPVKVELVHVLQDGLRVNVTARGPDRAAADRAADRIADAVVRATEARWRGEWQKRIDEAVVEADRARHERAKTQQQADAVRGALRDATGRLDVSPEVLLKEATALDEQLQRLELDLAAKQVRQAALAEQIAATTKSAEKEVAGDAIAGELEKVVKALEERWEVRRQMERAATASSSEVSEAAAAVAEARARLLERRRDAAAEAGGSVVGEWNKELRTLAIDVRELTARIQLLDKRREGLRTALPMLDGLRDAERARDRSRRKADDAEEALRDVESARRQAPPPQVRVAPYDPNE